MIKIRVNRAAVLFLFTIGGWSCTVDSFSQSVPINAVCAAPDGRLLVASDRGLFSFDGKSFDESGRIDSKIEKIYAIKFSADSSMFAISGGSPGESGVIEVFSFPKFKLIRRWSCHDDIATDLAWISDRRLISGDMTGACCQLDIDSKNAPDLVPIQSKGLLAVDRIAANQFVAAGLNNSIRVWNDANQTRDLNNHTAPVNDMAIQTGIDDTSKRVMVSASDDRTVRFWYPAIGRLLRFARLESIPNCVIWDESNQTAIAGCRDGKVRLIDLGTAKVTKTIPTSAGWINGLALNGNLDQLVVVGVKGMVHVGL